MKNYYSIADAVHVYGKSESTIRAIVKNACKNKNVIKHEILKNGAKKIYISESYLDGIFSPGKNTKNNTSNTNTSEDLVSFLKKQIDEKDKQIESLLERQRETNILTSQLQQKVLLIEDPGTTKKRWWMKRK